MAAAKKLEGSPAPAAETKPEAPKETPAPKPAPKAASPGAADRMKIIQAAKGAILKATEKKTIAEDLSPKQAVRSGSSCIDDLIGGTLSLDGTGPKCLGYPRRQITEIYGLESSGKTTAALQAIAEVQKQGGVAMFLDFEHALDDGYAKKIGVSFAEDKLMRYQPDTIEQGWKMIYIGIKAGVDLIVVDSVAAMVPAAELTNKKPGDAAKIGAVAASMAQMLPKIGTWLHAPNPTNPKGTALIFLNQVRAVIGGQGTSENTSGGHALKFFSYVRIRFTRIKSEFLKKKDRLTGREVSIPYGNLTRVKLVKCKVDGKQGYTTDIFIRFNYGIDDYYSMIESAVFHKIVKKDGSKYSFGGQSFIGRDKFRTFLTSNPTLFEQLRQNVLKAARSEEDAKDEDLEDEDTFLASMTEEMGTEDDPEAVREEIDEGEAGGDE
jgi:recombination protein RecA